MTLAENLVPGNERGSSPTNMTQAHGEGARHVGAADAGLKVVRKITCLGSGFVGGPTSAVTAFMSDADVTVVDVDYERIRAWNSDSLPIYEPGLNDIVYAARDGTYTKSTLEHIERRRLNGHTCKPNLHFSTDIDKAIQEADLIFVCVNTPTKANGIGKGAAADLAFVEAAARNIAHMATEDKIIVEKSTVPCRTAHSIREILSANAKPGVRFHVLSNPEFLAEGTAVPDLLSPDRVIIGSEMTAEGIQAAKSLVGVYSQWIPTERIITMNLWSSELSKLAANALLAQRISSVNAISAICEATGAEVNEVSHACGLDSRIGAHMLAAGPGFGGSCFQKDIFNIVYLSESLHLYEVADYWRGIINMNEYQKQRFAKRIMSCMFNNLKGKRIAVLGFAFKKNTSDTRESPAITLVRNLVAERAQVAIYDPKVKVAQIWQELEGSGGSLPELKKNVLVCKSGYDACRGADAVVIMTEWDEFSNKVPANPGDSLSPSMTFIDRHGPVIGALQAGAMTPSVDNSGLQEEAPGQMTAKDLPNIQKKRNTTLVIRDPTTGEVINFKKSSTHNVPIVSPSETPPIPFNNDENASTRDTRRSRLPVSEYSVDNEPQSSTEPLLSALTEIDNNLPARTNRSKKCSTTPPESSSNSSSSPNRYSFHLFPSDKSKKDEPSNSNLGPEETKTGRLDWARIAKGMRKPMWVFDGRNILDAPKLEALGFRVEAIGRASKYSGFG